MGWKEIQTMGEGLSDGTKTSVIEVMGRRRQGRATNVVAHPRNMVT